MVVMARVLDKQVVRLMTAQARALPERGLDKRQIRSATQAARHPAQQVIQRHRQHPVQTEEKGQVGARHSAVFGVVSEAAPGSLVPVVVVRTGQQALKLQAPWLAADVRTLTVIHQAVPVGLLQVGQLIAMQVILLGQKTIGPVSEVALAATQAERLELL